MALHKGEGWAVGNIDDLGDGPGFRKIRRELDVSEMGVNAIVLPPGVKPDFHLHERQEEVYFVHQGAVEIEFGDGSTHRLETGGLARVAARGPAQAHHGRRPGRRLPDLRRPGRLRGPRRAPARC